MGMPALIEFSSVEENALLCQELGLDFVELNMNMPYCFPQNLPSGQVRRLASELDVHFTMHMPDDFDLGSLHPPVRQGTLDRSMEALDWAIDSELRLLNFHINPGIYFTLPKFRVWIFDKFYRPVPRQPGGGILRPFGQGERAWRQVERGERVQLRPALHREGAGRSGPFAWVPPHLGCRARCQDRLQGEGGAD